MPTLRGLKLLETLDVRGPLTVTELAQATGLDKSWVSRIVSACEPDGWIVRENGRIGLGPRAALLAHASAAETLIRRAQPLVDAIAGVTGLMAQAYELVGSHATVVAAAGSGPATLSVGVKMNTSLIATAAGQMIAAQLEPAQLERLLPKEPFPDPLAELLSNPGYVAFASGRFAAASAAEESALPRNREQLQGRLEQVRANGFAIDAGDLHPQIGCIAVAWPGTSVTASLACMGSPSEISASAEQTRAVLEAATGPASTREDIVAAAATARHYSVAP